VVGKGIWLPNGLRLSRASALLKEESEVEGSEYQDNSYVRRQPFPEPVSEEQQIDRDDRGCHQDPVECNDEAGFSLRSPPKYSALQRHLGRLLIWRTHGLLPPRPGPS
jgi:hypothetical protein